VTFLMNWRATRRGLNFRFICNSFHQFYTSLSLEQSTSTPNRHALSSFL
jgi:hypothetical protein